jgi:hypothetical protein
MQLDNEGMIDSASSLPDINLKHSPPSHLNHISSPSKNNSSFSSPTKINSPSHLLLVPSSQSKCIRKFSEAYIDDNESDGELMMQQQDEENQQQPSQFIEN